MGALDILGGPSVASPLSAGLGGGASSAANSRSGSSSSEVYAALNSPFTVGAGPQGIGATVAKVAPWALALAIAALALRKK